MTPLSGTVRELACLALGHDDHDEPRCPSPDDDLVAGLVREVRALRALAGLTGDDPVGDNAAAVTALDDALTEAHIAEVPDDQLAGTLLDHLAGLGWAVVRDQR